MFEKVYFEGSDVLEELKECAKNIADKFEGFPLTIIVLVKSMIGKMIVDKWNNYVSRIKKIHLFFQDIHPHVHKYLYLPPKWSYDDFSNSILQIFFLYCAMFSEDEEIDVDILMRMWITKGLVKKR